MLAVIKPAPLFYLQINHVFVYGAKFRIMKSGLAGVAVKDELGLVAEGDRGVGGAQMVVHEVVDEGLALVAETQDEAPDAERGVGFHDVPDDRLFADGHHGLGKHLGHIPEPGPLAPAEDHHRRHLCRFAFHTLVRPYESRGTLKTRGVQRNEI